MNSALEGLLTRWLDLTTPEPRFAPYHVTPRQGRYAVRRRMLRELHRRFQAQGESINRRDQATLLK